jgi:hypothetical protein
MLSIITPNTSRVLGRKGQDGLGRANIVLA